jgi:hypothetical protein
MLRTVLLLGLPAALLACSVSDLPISRSDAGDGSAEASVVDSPGAMDAIDSSPGAPDAADESSPGTPDATGDGEAGMLDAASDEATAPIESGAPASVCPYSDWTGNGCAPVCGTGNFGPGGLNDGGPDQGLIGVVSALSVVDIADGMCGVAADGSILHIRAVGQNQWKLLLSVPSTVSSDGYLTYTLLDPTQPDQPPVAQDSYFLLTFDGKTLIFSNASSTAVEQASLQGTQIGPADDTPFAAVNQAIPAGANVEPSAIAPDGLSLYYNVSNAPNPAADGIYVATRTDTDHAFPAGSLLGQDIQAAFMLINGVSIDNLTGFFTDWSYQLHVVSRGSATVPWTAAGAGAAIPNNLVAIPTGDCRFIFDNCSGGGSAQTEICMLPRL